VINEIILKILRIPLSNPETNHESIMRFEYPLIGVTIFLILGILALIGADPNAIASPRMSQTTMETTESMIPETIEPESETMEPVCKPSLESHFEISA